jgi:hypothetical protein
MADFNGKLRAVAVEKSRHAEQRTLLCGQTSLALVCAQKAPLCTNLNVLSLVSHTRNLALSAENPSAGTAYARALFHSSLWSDQHAQG